MTDRVRLHQAALYFLWEALLNLVRSWRVSLLAVATIAVSLFIGGGFLMLATNLSQVVDSWKRGARVVVYLRPGVALAQAGDVVAVARGGSFVLEVAEVSPERARQRFRDNFPSIAELVDGWGEEPLPASLEIAFDPLRVETGELESWLATLRAQPQVAMVDDDRDWLSQLEAALRFVTTLGLGLGSVLVVAAIFTIASVIRLTAYLNRQEIGIMRLVGATELFIRGPFYVEGLLQGVLGGALALAGLYLLHGVTAAAGAGPFLSGLVAATFLAPLWQAVLVLLGALAGLVGAVTSLRREEL
jgi:cell division transport system permease protein